ncbi:presqualene diphosphate synthase HpnD [Massilia sp. TSP1-1-2]|uniref:presqualene diphosphate synthase HpnD n=1 Tax=unclassified Massilia TaxID=2609279 RepID=UPI003CED586F
MSPDEYCQQKTVQSGSSFYYSFLFLPPERRRAITAMYAFCREVDDTVDECTDQSIARIKLAWWRTEVSTMYMGTPTHPVMLALQPHLALYNLQEKHLQAIIDGMEMDLDQTRYLDFPAMQRYCWHVASVVGILSASIFGVTNPKTLEYAEKLGLAFQLTNIIRDVGEDARKGRIYLPVNELQQFGVTAADLLNARHSDKFEALMRFQVERAKKVYDEAFALLPQADRRAQRPGLMMAAIYRTVLDEIERDNYRVLTQRISLTPIRKLWLAWKTYIRG